VTVATAGTATPAVARALAAQGPARVRSLVLGSTTMELVRALAIPVVLVRGT
jgi:nucleotide-binding universal stress UspA family protein